MEIIISDDLKIVLIIACVILSVLQFTVFVPLGYYLEFKGRYYREKWFETENKRRAEHPDQFNSLSYRMFDMFRFGKKFNNKSSSD